jgi:RNA polymerase sigma-70 factor (ECF subfamily)
MDADREAVKLVNEKLQGCLVTPNSTVAAPPEVQLEAQLEQLYRDRYLYRMCFRFLRHVQNAEDAAGEVYLLARKHLPGFKGSSSLKTWLYRIVSHHCLNRLRGKQPEAWDDELLQTVPDPAPSAAGVEARLFHQQLLAAVEERARNGHPPWDADDYLIFELYFTAEKVTWEKVAGVVGRPVDTVKYRYHKRILPALRAVGAELAGQL